MRRHLALSFALALVSLPCSADDDVPGGELHLRQVEQLTDGGENAEAYWSPDGRSLIYQSTHPPLECDQIFVLDLEDEDRTPRLVSTGEGRTTCGYFSHDGERVIYASTHAAGPACPPPPDRSRGYVWAIYPTYELYSAPVDGGPPVRLTDNDAYDAEATVCPVDGSIVFTSDRDGDLDLYRMNPDGSEVTRLTDSPGYDGGAFFSADCTRLVWRASRPTGSDLEEYQALLAEHLVRPGRLEIWTADAGVEAPRQVTYLGAASFAPYFYPSADRIIFSSNVGDPRGREFELWAVDVDGTDLERITWSEGFDGFPMFSPDGHRLAFASNRNQGAPGETNLFVANWLEGPPAVEEGPADRYDADVTWLADDAREGRGAGTRGLADAAAWLAERFAEIGLEPAGSDGYRHPFSVPVDVRAVEGTTLIVDGSPLSSDEFEPLGFSESATVEASVVTAGYGITAPELEWDDYDGVAAEGRIVLVRRFVPATEAFGELDAERRYGDLRFKAWNAREHGATALLVVDLPVVAEGEEMPEEAPLPELRVEARRDAGLPVAVVGREVGAALWERAPETVVKLGIALEIEEAPAFDIVGRLPAPADGEPGSPVLVGAHYDHLGFGGRGSMAPGSSEVHNGADDNASGTAALLEAARTLVERRSELGADVWFVAFAGEELGLVGSTELTRSPPAGFTPGGLAAMINLDMVGRVRANRLSILSVGSAAEWPTIVESACESIGLDCALGDGDGYGPSDQTPFFAAGVPVLHLFSGTHEQYHKPSDDAELVNAAGGARVAALTARLALDVSQRTEPLTYVSAPVPPPTDSDLRSYGAGLGTIPDYVGPEDDRPGVLLAGVRPGSAAEQAGLARGDLLVGLAGRSIGDIYDFMYVLRAAKPGQTVTVVVERGSERIELEVTFENRRR